MRIGIDLDNTIIKYDEAFLAAASFLNINIPQDIFSKIELKEYCQSLDQGEYIWQRIQGLAYGKFLINNAKIFNGVLRFLWRLNYRGFDVKIISHKTKYGNHDTEKHELRKIALEFLTLNKIINCDSCLVEEVFFLSTRKQKISKIVSEKIDVFIDDLDRVIEDLEYYPQIKSFHFNEFFKNLNNDKSTFDWQQIDNHVNGTWNRDEVINLASKFNSNKIIDITKISQGRNSAVFKLKYKNDKYQKFKIYPIDSKHDRINSEFFSTKILIERGFNSVPKPLNYDKNLGVATYEWIDGEVIKDFSLDDISECSNFIKKLYHIRSDKKIRDFGFASSACKSGKDILEQLKNRLNDFKKISNPDLQLFLNDQFSPLMNYLVKDAKENWNFNYSFEEEMPIEMLTPSPSDFGFHNMVRDKNNNLTFIDFEYFGLDDPVKLISDFYFHPGMNLNHEHKRQWLKETKKIFGVEVYRRLNLTMPLFGLIWCLIILNDFRPDLYERRILANPNLDLNNILKKQLVKSNKLLDSIKLEKKINK